MAVEHGPGAGQAGRQETQPDPGKTADQAKTLLGLLVAGFAGVLSFLGIRSTEVSAILRNLEPLVGFVAIAFLSRNPGRDPQHLRAAEAGRDLDLA